MTHSLCERVSAEGVTCVRLRAADVPVKDTLINTPSHPPPQL